jgi:hypothetical protein
MKECLFYKLGQSWKVRIVVVKQGYLQCHRKLLLYASVKNPSSGRQSWTQVVYSTQTATLSLTRSIIDGSPVSEPAKIVYTRSVPPLSCTALSEIKKKREKVGPSDENIKCWSCNKT